MPPKTQRTQPNAGGRSKLPTQIQSRENSIYVGNIPFDSDPYELLTLLDKIGKVVAFRAPTDPETNKLRGFVFVEFADHKNVETAIKHFNNYQFGSRALKVDFATKQEGEPRVVGIPASAAITPSGSGGDEVWGAACDPAEVPQEIARVVSQLSPEMMRTLVYDTRKMLMMHPHEAQQALARYPQLSYALVMCLVRMGHLTEQEASTMLYNTQAVSPAMPLPTAPAAPYASAAGGLNFNQARGTTPTYGSSSNSPWLTPGGNNSPWGGGAGNAGPYRPSTMPAGGLSMYGRSPRVEQQFSGQSPASSTSASAGASNADRQKQKLIQLVTIATDEEIQGLPPDVRDQIRLLRQQLGKVTPKT